MRPFHPAPVRPAPAAVLAALALCVAPTAAQGQLCSFAEGSRSFQQTALPGGRMMAYFETPHLVCEDGVEIWADSAVAYVSENWAHFLGDVRFLDEIRELESDQARYFTRQGRLQAEGSLLVRDTVDGTVIEHGDLLYLRKGENRFEEEITVTTARDGVRPRLTFVPAPAPSDSSVAADSLGVDSLAAADTLAPAPEAPATDEPATPYVVDADRIEIRGQGYFKAIGSVEIRRDSVLAFADSAEYDGDVGSMRLDGSARVMSGSTDLQGRTIDLLLAGGRIDAANARGEAFLVSDDVRLEAPEIRIYMTDGRTERIVAVSPVDSARGPGRPDAVAASAAADSATRPVRPVALAEGYRLTADSIEVSAPGEVLERIFAAGRARSESQARDSLNVDALPPVARNDWIEGDTVIATFAPVEAHAAIAASPPADDGGARYELTRLVARVAARSLYRLPPADSSAVAGVDPPALHYVQAREIAIVMDDGEVDRMEVEGLTQGMHFEPDRVRAAPDTASGRRAVTPPDTGSSRPGYAGGPHERPAPEAPRAGGAEATAVRTDPRRSG